MLVSAHFESEMKTQNIWIKNAWIPVKARIFPENYWRENSQQNPPSSPGKFNWSLESVYVAKLEQKKLLTTCSCPLFKYFLNRLLALFGPSVRFRTFHQMLNFIAHRSGKDHWLVEQKTTVIFGSGFGGRPGTTYNFRTSLYAQSFSLYMHFPDLRTN